MGSNVRGRLRGRVPDARGQARKPASSGSIRMSAPPAWTGRPENSYLLPGISCLYPCACQSLSACAGLPSGTFSPAGARAVAVGWSAGHGSGVQDRSLEVRDVAMHVQDEGRILGGLLHPGGEQPRPSASTVRHPAATASVNSNNEVTTPLVAGSLGPRRDVSATGHPAEEGGHRPAIRPPGRSPGRRALTSVARANSVVPQHASGGGQAHCRQHLVAARMRHPERELRSCGVRA